MPEERHRPMIGWNTNTRILSDFFDEMGKTAGCAACASPGGKKHSVACLNWQELLKTRTIPQSERMTHGTDTQIQQDTQAATSTSTVHTPMTEIRDTDQPEHDESGNPGEWTPVKRIRLKSKPLVQSNRPRETPADFEHMEKGLAAGKMGTGS